MSDPYGAYDEYEDVDDMSLDDIDFIALQQAEKNSLETFAQEHDDREEAVNAVEAPMLASFTAEEIAEDERRRERELYGPPTPPMNHTAMTFEPRSVAVETTEDLLVKKIVEQLKMIRCPSVDVLAKTTFGNVWADAAAAFAAAFATAFAAAVASAVASESAVVSVEPVVQPSGAQADAGRGWASPNSSTGAVASSSGQGSPPAGEAVDPMRAYTVEAIEAALETESARWEDRLRPGRGRRIATPARAARARSAPAGPSPQMGGFGDDDELDCFLDQPLPGAPPGPEQQQEDEQEQSPRPKTEGPDGHDKRSG